MFSIDIEKLKKHPIGFAATMAITSATITGGVLYKVVIEDLRDKKADLVSELQVAKQRISSLEATVATYDGQCASRLQAQNKEAQDRCDKQLSVTIESSRQLASSNQQLIDEVQRKEAALTAATARLGTQQAALSQLPQLRTDERSVNSRITELHSKHKALSKEYGYNKAECEQKGKGFYSGNICEHASMNKAELESVERELESLKLRLSQVQQQIIQVQPVSK